MKRYFLCKTLIDPCAEHAAAREAALGPLALEHKECSVIDVGVLN